MNLNETGLILIGFQNDYFSPEGALNHVIEDGARRDRVLAETLGVLDALVPQGVRAYCTPIRFTETYSEIGESVGILGAIKEARAFCDQSHGSQTVPELEARRDQLLEIPGKRGLNAFTETDLREELQSDGIRNVVLAGVVTSLCIDSTARQAYELGFQVTILSDCTAGRTALEQEFYCEQIFPLYAQVCTARELCDSLQQLPA